MAKHRSMRSHKRSRKCLHGTRKSRSKSRSRRSRRRVCASKRGRKVGQFDGMYMKASKCAHGRRRSGACKRKVGRRRSRSH